MPNLNEGRENTLMMTHEQDLTCERPFFPIKGIRINTANIKFLLYLNLKILFYIVYVGFKHGT